MHDFLSDNNLLSKLLTFLDSNLQSRVSNQENSVLAKVKTTIKKKVEKKEKKNRKTNFFIIELSAATKEKKEGLSDPVLPPLFLSIVGTNFSF